MYPYFRKEVCMYIEPNTNIRILQNVPLDNTYKHTIYFANAEAQTSYFSGLTKFNLTRQSYQRKERGTMRIQISAEKLYNCNYLMFQNSSFEPQKWFYAFITSVEYVSNEVSEVGFEIDVMQTWFFDVTLKDSFVEREHSKTDNVGDNLIPEPFNITDYYCDNSRGTHLFNQYNVVIVSTYDVTKDSVYPAIFLTSDKLPTIVTRNVGGLHCIGCWGTSLYESCKIAQTILEKLSEYEDSVMALYIVPRSFINEPSAPSSRTYELPSDEVIVSHTFETTQQTRLGSYGVPRNKKLLTFPFTKFTIETFEGESNDYAYEYFEDSNIIFDIHANLNSNVSMCAVPRNYMGVTNNRTAQVILSNFPMPSFSTDSYRAWYAQNKTRLAISGLSSMNNTFEGVTKGLGNVITGSQRLTPKTGVLSSKGAKQMAKGYQQMGDTSISGSLGILGVINDSISARHLGFSAHVSMEGSLEIAQGIKDFSYIRKYVTPPIAKMIDNFFDMYGYATNVIKKPNRNVRPHWTYTKTIDCNIIGNAPADDVAKICSIYDSGITFWKNGNEVGNYSLNNQV